MTETPSGNRWEPARSPGPEPPPAPTAPANVPQPPVPPSYDVPVTAADGTRGRRRGLLVAGAAVAVLAAGATGYAIGSATGAPHDQVTRQGPPAGSGGGHDHDDDAFGPPGSGTEAG